MTVRSDKPRVQPEIPVLTIDGPSGSGKGTISRAVADALGWHLLDSGAMYRAVGYAAGMEGLDLSDAEAVTRCAETTKITFRDPEGWRRDARHRQRPRRDRRAPHRNLRRRGLGDCRHPGRPGRAVRQAACASGARRAWLPTAATWARSIFPDAPYKVFLTASAEERARRRYKQLKEKGLNVTLASLLREIQARDVRDANAPVAPLKPASSGADRRFHRHADRGRGPEGARRRSRKRLTSQGRKIFRNIGFAHI